MRKATLIAAMLALAGPVSAQGTTADLTARLREVLPVEVADRVIATVSEARSRGLPARALEQRALMLARKGTDPASIARSVADQSRAMGEARAALARGRAGRPADDDVTAGAEAMRKGVTGAEVSELAKSAPSGRSLAVPLFVIGSLVDRGLPSAGRGGGAAAGAARGGRPANVPPAGGGRGRPSGRGRP